MASAWNRNKEPEGRTNQEVGTRGRNQGQPLGTETRAGAERPEWTRGRKKRKSPEFAVQTVPRTRRRDKRNSGPCIGERTTTVLSSRYGWLSKPPPENSTPPYDRDFFAVFFCTCSCLFPFQPHRVIPPAQSTTANLCADFPAQTSALIFAPIPRTDSEASAGRRPFPVSDGCGKGRKSATFSAPRCVACRGVNRPHPARSPAVDYSATSLSVRLRELIVR